MKKSPILLLVILSLFTTACAQAEAAAQGPDEVPVVVDDFTVVAEGRLVPHDSIRLGFAAAGEVAEILVEEGEIVRAGDVLARLGGREPYEAAISSAALELAAAALESAAAEADLLAAEQALEAIHENWPDQATLAQQALKDARQRQYNAERNLGYLTTSAGQTDIDLAYTALVLAEDALEKARDAFEPYENKPADNLTRATLQAALAQAQLAYDDAVRNYNALSGPSNEFDVSQGEVELAIANAQLDQAETDYNELILGPDPDDIALAEARIATAEQRLETAAQRIRSAEANLAAAQSSFDDLDLTAAIDGTLVQLDLVTGQQVAPGVAVALIADFSRWYVETDNLTEIEVVAVATGQTVTVVADALPEVVLTGAVEDISDVFEEKLGDITFTASILLDEIDPRLRWGMTVVVTFEGQDND